MSLTAHYDSCDDAYELTITTANGAVSVVRECPCPELESPDACGPDACCKSWPTKED